MRDVLRKLEFELAEVILVLLIFVEILDFLTILPPPVEYMEKIIAFAMMGFLFYKASITDITFGHKEKWKDALIVVGFMLLSVKTAIGFSASAAHHASVLSGFYTMLVRNAGLIEMIGFVAGTIILATISAISIKEKITKQCILKTLHEKNAKTYLHKIGRFFLSYLVLLAIYLLIFTFAIEWLAITVDAPILIILLLFYVFVIVKRGKKMTSETFLYKVSNTSEEFYERFISFFHTKKTIMKGITGILVLHMLVEILHFIIPYITSLMYAPYFKQLGPGHEPLAGLISGDLALAGSIISQTGVLIIYLLNVLAILMILFGPAYAWMKDYNKSKTPNISWLFFLCLFTFVTLPVFLITKSSSRKVIGVDIITQQIPVISNVWGVVLASAVIGLIFWILSKLNKTKIAKIAFGIIFLYFGQYLYYFGASVSLSYANNITALFNAGNYVIALHLAIFLVMLYVFYIGGFIFLVHKTFKNAAYASSEQQK
ncbi:hypothetical protein HQ545_02295 [Candidatus Woesearchaeota archaeon]|nr:hypothetical protein [Candidatus Woesearchaeota archaeon]